MLRPSVTIVWVSMLRGRVLWLLAELTRTGTPAIRSRGRKLLARLQRGRPLVGDRLADHRLEPLGRGPGEIGQVDLVMLAAPTKPLLVDEPVQPLDGWPLGAERAMVQQLGGATLAEGFQAHPPGRPQRPLGRGLLDRLLHQLLGD
jgi:hypothetical protein